MNKRPQYLLLAGIGLFTIAVLMLLASPDLIFSPTITVIGNSLSKSALNEVSVTTRTDFSSPEQIKNFPLDIGKWHGREYDTSYLVKSLGANFALIRGYNPETFTQPVFLTILQSKTNSSFHTIEGCLGLQGYEFQENQTYGFSLNSPGWTQGNNSVTIPVNKLVAIRNARDGSIIERRLVLYFYVKGNQFYSDTITLIEVQGLVPIKGNYEGTLKEEEEFLSQAIPLMFQPGNSGSQSRPLIATLAAKGAGGYLGIAVILLIPLGMISYPLVRRRESAK